MEMKVGSRQCSGFKGVWLKFGVPGLAPGGIKQDSAHPGPALRLRR